MQVIKRRPGAAQGKREGSKVRVETGSCNLRDGVVPTLSSAKKILDILEGKRVITPPPALPVIKEPAVEALEAHPLAQDQAKYLSTNLRRFKPKKRSGDSLGGPTSNKLFARVIRELPDDKQKSLLQSLSKISKSLEFGGLVMHEDDSGVLSSPLIKNKNIAEPLSVNASIRSLLKEEGSLQGGSSISGSSLDDSIHLSVSDSYASVKSYGLIKPDAAHAESIAVLDRIGAGLRKHPTAEKRYDLSGRGPIELVPPTELASRLIAEFKVHISTIEIEVLMRKFDVAKRGVVDIVDILGNAKNVHSKTIYLQNMEELERETQVQRKMLLEKRAEYRARMGGREADGIEVEGSAKQDTMHTIIDKLSVAAYEAIRSKSLRPLNCCRPKLFPVEFKALLVELNCQLSTREAFVLERRYFQGQTGTVDAALFRAEFVALGKDMIRDSRRVDAMQSFVRALSRGAGDIRGADAEGADLESVGGSSSIVSSLNQSESSSTFGPSSNLLVPAKSADRASAQQSIVKSQMTIEMADDWISDPLQPSKANRLPSLKVGSVNELNSPNPAVKLKIGTDDRGMSAGLVGVSPQHSRASSRASSRGARPSSRPHSVTLRPLGHEEQLLQSQMPDLSVPQLEPLPFAPLVGADLNYSGTLYEEHVGGMALPFAVVRNGTAPSTDGSGMRLLSGSSARGSSSSSKRTVTFIEDAFAKTEQ